MKYTKIFAACVAALIMTSCHADEPVAIQPPEISLPSQEVRSSTAELQESEQPSEQPSTVESTRAEESAEPVQTTSTAATTTVSTAASSASAPPVEEVTAEAEDTEEPDPVDYGEYLLTAEQMEFTQRSVFIGDSICKGYGTYNIISFDHVFANGSMGTRNFWDYTFSYGKNEQQITFEELLHRTTPELVFLSMGMNDINMIHPEVYRSNYARIVDTVLAQSDAVVYLCAMTPVSSNFTSNERVDCFNGELQALVSEYPNRVYYVDYGRLLLNDEGLLNNQLDGGDGVHLAPYAYRIALWEIYRTLVEDGTLYPKLMEDTSEVSEEATAEVSEEAPPATTEAAETAELLPEETADTHEQSEENHTNEG